MLSLAKAGDIPALKHIWTACFGDEDTYQELFFQNRFSPENAVVWREEGIPVGMIHLMPYFMADEAGNCHLCYYLYAVSTLPEFQGRGISTKLLRFAEDLAGKRGAAVTSLVPAETSLFDFYRKRGYHTEYSVKRVQLERPLIPDSAPMEFHSCSLKLLCALRARYFGRTPFFVQWDEAALRYILLESEYVGRECLAFVGSEPGYLFCEHRGNSLFVREIGCEPEDFVAVTAGLFARYPEVCRITLRLKADSPLAGGDTVPFGMARYLPETKDKAALSMTDRFYKKETTTPYMGLMLD